MWRRSRWRGARPWSRQNLRVTERMGARATALFAVAALCASFAFAFAAVSFSDVAEGGSDVVTGSGVRSTPAPGAPRSSTTAPASEPTTTTVPPETTVAPTTTAAPVTTPPPTTAAPPGSAVDPLPSVPPPLPVPTTAVDGAVTANANRVFVFGDSVILGTKAVLPQHLPGWDVLMDAEESRFEHEAPDILRARRGDIGRVAVIMIGHNSGAGYNHETWIRKMMDELSGVERVVFLTAAEWGPGPAEFNATLRRLAPEYPSIVIADWNALNVANPGYTFDGLHLLGPGQTAMSELIARAVGPLP